MEGVGRQSNTYPCQPGGGETAEAAWQFTRAGRKAAQDEWVAFLTLLRGLFVAHAAADPGHDNVSIPTEKN